jgi:hypothetical protein
MATQAELEAKQAEIEEKIKANEAEMERSKDIAVFGILVTGWVKQIEAGTVDWDDLTERLEAALATAQRMRGTKT